MSPSKRPPDSRGSRRRKKFAADVDTATGGEVRRFRPSHIRADHSSNQRFAPYDTMPELVEFIGDKCCFTPAQIEGRLASFMAEGQIDAVKVSMSGTGHPDLEVGFLRHCAFLLAEVRDIIDDIPGAKGTKVSGIRAEVVAAPKSQGDHRDRARRNFAENNERLKLSPVDRALYFKRRLAALDEDGKTMSRQALADELTRSVDYINKHLRLFDCLTPEQLLAVHEGTLPMVKALAKASKSGAGNNRGPRGSNSGVKKADMKRAITHADKWAPPKVDLVDAEVRLFAELIAGTTTLKELVDDKGNDTTPPAVRKWIDWLTPPADLGKTSKYSGKKAAPKPGAKD